MNARFGHAALCRKKIGRHALTSNRSQRSRQCTSSRGGFLRRAFPRGERQNRSVCALYIRARLERLSEQAARVFAALSAKGAERRAMTLPLGVAQRSEDG
jgi:hypothetical protein